MKRLLTFLFAISFAFLITPNGFSQTVQKRLIGTWKAIKIEKYNIPETPDQLAGKSQKGNGNATDSASVARAREQFSKLEARLNRLIQSELHSTLTIKADKTAIEERAGKTIQGTWKLKNKGQSLLVTSKKPARKITIDIVRVNDTSAVVIENLPIGGLKVTYQRVKK